ncbi:DUF5803 family protein [Halomicrobium urmianum]|uniref:DUF5803 family protein n=1 Tax=Halomicrobium urmianum TaxID=1586233 RepID=UPI001CD98CEA|nr:DUF5803 family protein [Halomicrobium urmianum]
MRRRLAILGLLAVLAALAGCGSILGPGDPDPEDLNRNATYDWSDEADTYIVVNRSSFKGVYDVSDNDTLEAYRTDDLGRDRHLPIESLRYRFPNGTVVTPAEHDGLSAEQTRQRTIVHVPNGSDGRVAFVAPRHGKQFVTPVFVDGSHAVTLPPNARVGVPLLSQVDPGGYETDVDGERMTIRWDEISGERLRVRYYLQRDLLIFGAVVVAAVVIGSGGALYYYRQIQRLKRRREESGIDVGDDDDPRDRGPPPGMR